MLLACRQGYPGTTTEAQQQMCLRNKPRHTRLPFQSDVCIKKTFQACFFDPIYIVLNWQLEKYCLFNSKLEIIILLLNIYIKNIAFEKSDYNQKNRAITTKGNL